MRAVMQIDDFPIEGEAILKGLDELKILNSTFKVTLFCMPQLMTNNWYREIWRRKCWVRCAMHGFITEIREGRQRGPTHPENEGSSFSYDDYMRMLAENYDTRMARVFKAGRYTYSPQLVKAIRDFDMMICVRSLKDLKDYVTDDLLVESEKEYGLHVVRLFNHGVRDFFCHGRCSKSVDGFARRLAYYKRNISKYPFIFSEDLAIWV